jgi:hypothetical protein
MQKPDPAQLIETLVEAEQLPVAAVGNDRLGTTLVQRLTQLGTVVGFVAEQAFW